MVTVNNIKAKLEKEMIAHSETRCQLDNMSAQLYQLQQLIDLERTERAKLENAVNSGSLPDDAKVGLSGSSALINAIGKTSGSFVTPMPPVPPPPPFIGALPPPPPPPMGAPPAPGLPGMGPALAGFVVKKNIPQSSQALKSFNWSKLPDNVAKNSIWKDIDDTRVSKCAGARE